MKDTALIHPDNWGELLRRLFVFNPEHRLMFPTWEFLVLFLLFLGGYLFLVNRKPARILYILFFSLFFYFKSDGIHFLLLIFSTIVDYLLGILIFVYQLETVPYREARVLGREIRVIDIPRLATVSEQTNGPSTELFPGGENSSRLSRAYWLGIALMLTLLDQWTRWMVSPAFAFRRQRLFLVISVGVNLGLLAWFKYTNFLIGTINDLTDGSISLADIALPVGISFFTFQTMSYTIDIYRGKLEPLLRLREFGFFVSFFPQLVAGPIVRASDFLPQIRADIRVSQEDLGRGLFLICSGLIKKVVISDSIAFGFVDSIFEEPALYTGFENLMAVYGYALQIYCDFSGYSDMAIGIGLLLGFRLPVNFRAPYQSASIQEFWRRWHISLSSWLRDYLYISMGGNRRGQLRTYLNLMLTMLLGGLWHGASWRFIMWGALHGGALAIGRMLSDSRTWLMGQVSRWFDELDQAVIAADNNQGKVSGFQEWIARMRWKTQGIVWIATNVLGRLGGIFFTFHFVCFTWIYFRAESFEKAMELIRNIWYNFHPEVAWQLFAGYDTVFLMMLLGFLLHFIPEELDRKVAIGFARVPLVAQSAVLATIMYVVMQSQAFNGGQPFIYFQF